MMADRRRSARRASRPLGRRQAVPTRADRSRDRFPALRGVRVRIPRDGMSRKTSADKRRRTRHPRDALAGSPCPFRKTCSRRHPLRFQRRGKPPPLGVGRPASMPRFGELARENHVVSCDSLGASGGSASAGGRGPYLPPTASEATEPGRPDLDGSSTGRRSRESGDAPPGSRGDFGTRRREPVERAGPYRSPPPEHCVRGRAGSRAISLERETGFEPATPTLARSCLGFSRASRGHQRSRIIAC